MKFRWPFNTIKPKQWVGINLSTLAPSAVIYSDKGVVAAIACDKEQGIEGLASWLKKHVSHGMPAILVLDDADYELLLVEAPNVPDEEMTAAIEFRIGDLLAQPVEETAIQAIRLPNDAYRGRMSMAHVIASPNVTIKNWVHWAEQLFLKVEIITVPELSLLNLLAASSVEHGIALLELGPNYGSIRLYQDGALYLTRQIEMGLEALEIVENAAEKVIKDANKEGGHNLELSDMDFVEGSDAPIILDEIEISQLESDEIEQTERTVSDSDIYAEDYVGFAPKPNVNEQKVQSLVLEVQRSLDYYESQLGMGQITQLWLMAGDMDLTHLVDAMQPVLTARIEQPNIADKLKQNILITASPDAVDLNKLATALGGALAYVTR